MHSYNESSGELKKTPGAHCCISNQHPKRFEPELLCTENVGHNYVPQTIDV